MANKSKPKKRKPLASSHGMPVGFAMEDIHAGALCVLDLDTGGIRILKSEDVKYPPRKRNK